jgi:hypothetical protein
MILDRLDALAREKRRLLLRRAIVGALVVLLLGTVLAAALDIWKILPMAVVRMAGLCCLGVALAVFLRVRAQGFSSRDAARAIEAGNHGLGQSVRTAAQVATGKDEPSLVGEALLSSTSKLLERADTSGVVKVPFLRPLAIAAAALLAFWLGAAVVSSDWRTAAQRLAGKTVPYTRIETSVEPGVIVSDDPARVQAVVSGRTVAAAKLHLREAGGDWREMAMQSTGARRFDAVFASVPQSIEYFVTAGDGRSPTLRVECRIPAKLQSVGAHLTFPDYTGLPAIDTKSGGIDAVEGTKAGLAFEFDRPIIEAKIMFADETSAPVTCDGASARAEITVGKQELKWHVAGRDARGIAFETQPFLLKGFSDKMPEIKLAEPVDDVEVTPLHELIARLRAKDDFGLEKVGLVIKVGDKNETLLEKNFEARNVKAASEMATAFLEKYPLTMNDNVQVYAYATDRKPRNGARAVSPLISVDIREYKRRFILAEEGDKPCECVNHVERLIAFQRRVFSDTSQLAELGSVQEVPAALIAALAIREQKAVGMAEELVAIIERVIDFVSGGELELAGDARAHMETAVDSLKAVSLAAASTSENEALTLLLKLRKQMIYKIGKGKEGAHPASKKSVAPAPIPLDELAKRIERAADAEKSVGEQAGGLGAGASAPETLLREQEVALGEAGEALSELDAHPSATGLLRTRGTQAEDLMRAATAQMSHEPAAAPESLAKAEGSLRELAGHLELLAGDGTEETLQKLQARAEEAAQCLGSCAACLKGEGSGSGADSPKVASAHVSALAEKAATLDDALRQWAESSAQQDPGKSARLDALREAQKTGNLPQDLRALAGKLAKSGELVATGKQAGDGAAKPGENEEAAAAAKLAEGLAERHREVAAKLANEREEIRRGRAERLVAAREKLKPFMPVAAPRMPDAPPGTRGQILPMTPAVQQRWAGKEGEIVLGAIMNLGDEKLLNLAENLGRIRQQNVIMPDAFRQVDERLVALLAGLQRNTSMAVRATEVPGPYRRVIENYFRALSDDFGDEKWDTKDE